MHAHIQVQLTYVGHRMLYGSVQPWNIAVFSMTLDESKLFHYIYSFIGTYICPHLATFVFTYVLHYHVAHLCGLPHCIVCRDSLVALGDNKTLICASFHGKNACFQGKSRRLASGYLRYYISRTMSHTHFVHCN